MARKMTGPDHLEAGHDCLDELAKARQQGDWPKVAALAAAAQAHLSMASMAWQVSSAPAALLAGRQGQRWLATAAVEQAR